MEESQYLEDNFENLDFFHNSMEMDYQVTIY
jgi:hypothetical protein